MNPRRLEFVREAKTRERAFDRADMFRAGVAANGSREAARGLLKD